MTKCILSVLLLLLASSCQKDNPASQSEISNGPTGDTWAGRAAMPTARAYTSCAEVNGKIYVIGGLTDPSTSTNVVEVYDPTSDTWATKGNMPESASGVAVVSVGGKIYAFGGRSGGVFDGTTLNHTYLYDPVADSWTRKADMPQALTMVAAALINGKIYLMGGAEEGFIGTNLVDMYDPVSDTWTPKAGFETGRALSAAAVYQGKVYLIAGGTAVGDAAGYAFSTVDCYDPAVDTWMPEPPLAEGRLGHGAAVIGTKLYLCGGFSSSTLYSDLREYDFTNDVWTSRAAMSGPRRCFAYCAWNGQFYVFGGITTNSVVLKSVAMYTPPGTAKKM
jgi:N-acetylneuraminic acid mutarotase